jgi:hypothetical protein
MANTLPRGDIAEKDKTPEWCRQHLEYAENLLTGLDNQKAKTTRLYDSYNGIKAADSVKWLTSVYGIENRAKFIAYRVGRTKLSLLQGEFIKRPLSATVRTINKEALSNKMEHEIFMLGAMLAKKELEELRDKVGVDVMNGAPIPESKEDPLWQKMSYKDKQEDIMQIIIDEQIKNLNLVKKFGDMFLDALITGKCFCKIEIDEKGDVDIIQIDPRNFIYEEIDKDDFIKKSPIIGARTTMPLYEILRRYELTKEQRDLLNAIQANPDGYISRSRNMLRKTSSGVVADVIHIEWKASRPRYYMVSPKTPNQLAFDSENTEITKELFDYEKHQEHYDNGHTNGKWRIESKWEEDLWEATRIGGIKELDLNMRRKPFQFRRHDAPAYILDSSYMGCLFNTVNGTRVPLQQYIENLDQQFDIVMYQILKELNRAKGKILAFDMAAAPKGVTAKKIVYDALNDGFVMLNTAAAHNFSGRNLDLKQLIQQEDLGLSDSFPALIQLKQDILNNLDRLTGINEFREGASPASSTVTNAQQSVQNSRTITEPIFFMMQLFVERCMQTLVEATKVSWAFYKTQMGEQILGTDKYQFMKVTPDLGLRDYGIHIEDGGRYAELKNYMNGLIQYGLNGKNITMFDALKFYMAPTFVEAEQAFYNAVERTQKAAQEQMAAQQQFDAQMQQQQLQQQLQIAQEDREDRQAADTQNIITKGQVQMEVDNNKAQNKTIELHQKSQSDLLNNLE